MVCGGGSTNITQEPNVVFFVFAFFHNAITLCKDSDNISNDKILHLFSSSHAVIALRNFFLVL